MYLVIVIDFFREFCLLGGEVRVEYLVFFRVAGKT